MATVTLHGATRCAVSRPGELKKPAQHPVHTIGKTKKHFDSPKTRNQQSHDAKNGKPHGKDIPVKNDSTLRHVVVEFFNKELARYHGRAEVIFDHTSERVLDLTGPTYTFQVRRRQNHPLGLIPLEVDVLADGRTVQTVPLVVQVTMIHPSLVARRAINQGATIQASDVELVPLTFTRLDRLGMNDPARAVGQRCKKFHAAGSLIQKSDIEAVPIVVRGQLVTLASVSGSVRVVTTARAAADGLLGDVIKVRAVENKRIEYDATIVGPGKVQIGGELIQPGQTVRVAGGNR